MIFYKILCCLLIGLGIYQTGNYVEYSFTTGALPITETNLNHIAIAISTILIGVLNFVYLYENSTTVPKWILLLTNFLYIGFQVLLITSNFDKISSIGIASIVVILSILIINKKI